MASYRFAIVVSRFNEEITNGLLQGARELFAEASVPDENVTVIRVPGAFEIPITAIFFVPIASCACIAMFDS